jgi:splicing factor 3B subunit 2
LWNFQRYGPPPAYHPHLKIPGLNAPLPTPECQYGFHPGGWGQPPVDAHGRLIYGGNPLDPPGSSNPYNDDETDDKTPFATSEGKIVHKAPWGALPMKTWDDEASEEEEDDESADSEDDAQDMDEITRAGVESFMPPPPEITGAAIDLRKPGMETPIDPNQPQQLYQILP